MKSLNQPVEELIEIRHSVRNYTEERLSEELIYKINAYIATVENPFHKKVNIKLIEKSSLTDEVKLGTYGVIKGENYYFVASCENDEDALMALGYNLEQVVLYCTSLGLGSVWLGGTFKKLSFAKAIGLRANEVLPIIAPVGYEGGKKSFLAKMMGDNSKRRKKFSEIFFDHSFEKPLSPENAAEFWKPLEMLRLAPSAVNKQPWRVLKEGNTVHFYLTTTKGLTRIDIGIGMCHFDMTAKDMQLEGAFTDHKDAPKSNDFTYVTSWSMK